MKNEKGFTLIEIVMVIILLGILAAVAIPRFMDLSGEAKEGATKGILGGVRGAVSIAYANYALHGNARWPTTNAELRATMSDGRIPAHPFTNLTTVTNQTGATRTASTTGGWVYSTDAAGRGLFYSAYSTASSGNTKNW